MKGFLQFYFRLLLRKIAEICAPGSLLAPVRRWELRNVLLRRIGLHIGADTIVMPGMDSLISLHHLVFIGSNCVIGPMSKLWSFHRLEIGDCTVVGAECSFANGSHDPVTLEPSAHPLIIGRGCRIGHGVRIVRGVRIGDLAVIEPGSIVTADVEEAAVVGGVPARFIARRQLGPREHLWGDRWYCPKTFEIVAGPEAGSE